MALSQAPRLESLQAIHQLDGFCCGELALDEWLKKRAVHNQRSGASRTFVALQGERVIGYYALASGAVSSRAVTGSFRRNMPEPIPVAMLGRLAVDLSAQGKGIGRAMLGDAWLRVARAAEAIGIRGLLVHALTPAARDFYLAMGFELSPTEPLTLFARLHALHVEGGK